MTLRLGWVCAVIALAYQIACMCSPLSFETESRLSWSLSDPEWRASSHIRIACEATLWDWDIVLRISDGRGDDITFGLDARFGSLAFAQRLGFDAAANKFDRGILLATLTTDGLRIEGVACVTPSGMGYGLSLHLGQDELLRQLRLRFNLKRSLNEVAEETFAPGFSFAEARFRMSPSWARKPVHGWLWLDPTGLVEAGASTHWALFPDQGISLGSTIRFFASDRQITLTPLWVYETPACVEIIATLDLGETLHPPWSIDWHAIGIYGDLGDFSLRALHVVDLSASVIKSPYSDLISLKWQKHLGDRFTEATIKLYFGEIGFLGLGEADLALTFSPTDTLQIDLSADVSPSSLLRFELRWALHL